MKNIKDVLVTWQADMGHPGEDWMFTFVDNNKKNLLICVGDSWTWGNSLGENREKEMYGRVLSDHLNANLINLGCPGFSNSWALLNCEVVLTELAKNNNYENVYVVITLTENARDVSTVKSYDFLLWANTTELKLSEDMYDAILVNIQQYWFSQIEKLISLGDKRFVFFVGQNFVWHDFYNSLTTLPNVIITDSNWIELLADKQNLPRPIRTNLVTGWIFDTFDLVNQEMKITDLTYFKKYTAPLIEKALLVNKWLDTSKLNYKRESKHPNADGHRIWADHIFQKIQSHTTKDLL